MLTSDANFTSSASFCYTSEFNATRNRSISCDATSAADVTGQSAVHPAYYVFVAAQLLSGVGTSGLIVLGLTYIDENSAQAKSSLYIGKLPKAGKGYQGFEINSQI
jgi:Organic Anion Transporter Polypeptide (OATP) family